MSPADTDPSELGRADIERFAEAFVAISQAAHRLLPAGRTIADRVSHHLGVDASDLPSVGTSIPRVERPNLQLALDELLESGEGDRALIGLSPEIAHYPGFAFPALLAGRFHGPAEPVPPVYEEHPVDVDRELACVVTGIWLLHRDADPVVVCVHPGEMHVVPSERKPRVEVFAADRATAESMLSLLDDRRRAHNVYRGKVLSFSHTEYGEFGINFMPRPATRRDEVILPDRDLASIERHTVGIGQLASSLAAAGQHLKRGLLLHGPPGTGKTHTVGYLLAAMPERTTVVLQGPSVGALGHGSALVRTLAPSMLVIEDVDLVASERAMGAMASTNPLMFQLLNEMDGLNADDDVLFVLTTNRFDILEPALADRPGRIDHAVEIARPDVDARRRLLHLYLGRALGTTEAAPEPGLGSPLDSGELDDLVERMEGVTASFIRELVRRATHHAIEDGTATVDSSHLAASLEELVTSRPETASILGLGAERPADRPRDPLG